MEEWIGTVAAVLTTVSFLPQVIQVLRTRETRGISLHMYALFTFGVGLWFLYGIAIDRPPVYVANGITLALATVILTMKIRFG